MVKTNRFLLSFALLPVIAFAQLPLTEVERLARERNPIIVAARHETQAARAEARQWIAPFLPIIDLFGYAGVRDGEARDTGSGVEMLNRSGTGLGASFGWDLYTGGRDATARKLATQYYRDAQLREGVVWLDLLLEVRTEFSVAARVQEEIAAHAAAVESAIEIERAMKERLEAGRVPQSMMMSATAERLKRERELGELKAELVGALARVVACCGAELSGGTVGAWDIKLEAPESLDAALQLAQTHSLEIQLANLEILQQKSRYESAVQSNLPSLKLFANADSVSNPAGDKKSGVTAGVSLSVPLLDGGLRRGARSEYRNKILIVEAHRDHVANQVRAETTATWAQWETSSVSIKAAEAEVVAAGEAMRITLLRFEEGRDTQADVSRVRSELLSAQSSLASAKEYQHKSWSKLKRLIGS